MRPSCSCSATTSSCAIPTGLWDFAIEAPRSSTRHMTLQLPEGVTYASRRSSRGLCAQPAGHCCENHRAAALKFAHRRDAAIAAHATSADRPAGDDPPFTERLHRAAGPGDAQGHARASELHAMPAYARRAGEIYRGRRGRRRALPEGHHAKARDALRPAHALSGARRAARSISEHVLCHPAALLFDLVLAAVFAGRGEPHRRHAGGAGLVGRRAISGRRLDLHAGPPGRRDRARLRAPAEPALRAARRSERADDPGRPRHRLCAVPRLPAAARRGEEGRQACRQVAALLWLPPSRPRLVL